MPFDDRRAQPLIEPPPAVREPAVDGLELMLALDPAQCLSRVCTSNGTLVLVQVRLQLGARTDAPCVRAVRGTSSSTASRAPAARSSRADTTITSGGSVERRLQGTDVALDLRVFEDVAVHLRKRRVAVDETAQQDDELEQIRVGLLPERLFRPAEQVVQQCGDRKGDRVRIEIVVQRVVADAGVEPISR